MPHRASPPCELGRSAPVTRFSPNCVIGAGSVVTKDLPANVVAVGTPEQNARCLEVLDSVLSTAAV